jgi:endonuclease/exonuclease/phosphatase family metal-dependent hydrolase
MMKKLVFRILIGLGILPVLFLLFLLISTLAEYRPPNQIVLETTGSPDTLKDSATYSILIWNIGYAGLGANMDFFYDGGKGVRDTRANVTRNFRAISSFLKSNDSINFILLQEADIASKRSYRMNEVLSLDSMLGKNEGYVGINYQVGFVPVPLYSPMGKVKSGIVTYSDLVPADVRRYSYPGSFSWPSRTFNLKRCFLASRFELSNGKEFILINTHNSAYDDGSLRAAEIKALASFVQQEFDKGNYILIGGDWNQCPSGFKPTYAQPFDTLDLRYLPTDFLPGWKQVYPTDGPTNRRVQTPYNRLTTLTTVIDFYVASPNIKIHSVHRVDLDFANSDHQPVILTFSFKQ